MPMIVKLPGEFGAGRRIGRAGAALRHRADRHLGARHRDAQGSERVVARGDGPARSGRSAFDLRRDALPEAPARLERPAQRSSTPATTTSTGRAPSCTTWSPTRPRSTTSSAAARPTRRGSRPTWRASRRGATSRPPWTRRRCGASPPSATSAGCATRRPRRRSRTRWTTSSTWSACRTGGGSPTTRSSRRRSRRCASIVRDNPGMVDVWIKLGEVLASAGSDDGGRRCVPAGARLARRSSSPTSSVSLGFVELNLKRLPEAEAAARRALNDVPTKAHELLARVALARGDFAAATEEARGRRGGAQPAAAGFAGDGRGAAGRGQAGRGARDRRAGGGAGARVAAPVGVRPRVPSRRRARAAEPRRRGRSGVPAGDRGVPDALAGLREPRRHPLHPGRPRGGRRG